MFKIAPDVPKEVQKNHKVMVVLSTYNGERYLREQLDSVLRQEGVEVNILIRDDGSNDSTVDILKEYSQKNRNLEYYTGENQGVIKSFNDLLENSELDNYCYIAFCDQDDVWADDKLRTAVNFLQSVENEYPAVYCSNLMIVDESLNIIRPMFKRLNSYTKSMSMVQNIGAGCTQVFNQKALEKYRQGIGAHMEMHDYWMTLVGMFFGDIIYDPNPHIQYRQHSKNVVGAPDKRIVMALKHLKKKAGIRINMLNDFVNIYDVDSEDKKIISNLCYYNTGIFNRLKILFSAKYVGINKKVTLGFKVRVILNCVY